MLCVLSSKWLLTLLIISACGFLCAPTLDRTSAEIKNIEKCYKLTLKCVSLVSIFKFFGDFKTPDPYFKSSSLSLLDASGLFKSYTIGEYDDIFLCTHSDVEVEISECDMEFQAINEPIRKSRVVIFNIPLNRQFKSKTIVLSNKNTRKIFNISFDRFFSALPMFMLGLMFMVAGFLIICANPTNPNHWLAFAVFEGLPIIFMSLFLKEVLRLRNNAQEVEMDKVSLENVEFMKNYKVLTDNQVEARTFLTPAFMTRFKRLQKVFSSKDMRCSFVDNSLLILVETKKDLFEMGNIYTPLNYRTIKKLHNQIMAVHDMIDCLKLDTML